MLAACSAGAHRAAPTSAPTSTSAPTTDAPPYYPPSPYDWSRSGSPALLLGGGAGATIATVLAPPPGGNWIAAGSRYGTNGVPSALYWTSADARTWAPSPLPAAGPAQAQAAAQYDGQTVVVGSLGSGSGQQAAAWLSSRPGAPFEAVAVPAAGATSDMDLVATGALGFFAAGSVDGRFALWSSPDGRTWSEDPSAERQIDAAAGAKVDTLAAVGSKVYAAGSEQTGPYQSAAVWSSGNGIDWSQVTTAQTELAGPGDRAIYSLAPLGDGGLVAVGALDTGAGWVPASWISPDGVSWSQPSTDFAGVSAPSNPQPPFGPSGGSAARAVASIATVTGGIDLVAAGGGPSGGEAWRSSDGIHWSNAAIPAAVADADGWRATLVAATMQVTVVADGDPGEAHLLSGGAAGWTQPSSDPTVFGPVRPFARPVALHSGSSGLVLSVEVLAPPQSIGDAAAGVRYLSSADGSSWTPAPAAAAAVFEPRSLPSPDAAVTRSTSGWVAAGGADSPAPQGWSSADGAVWSPAGSLGGGLPEAPLETVNGVCASPAGAAAAVGAALVPSGSGSGSAQGGDAGTAGGWEPAAWFSASGTAWRRSAVQPPAAAGATAAMSGCIPAGSGLVAFGQASAADGEPLPGLWRSAGGSQWTAASPSGFAADGPPLVDLAAAGRRWAAVASDDPAGGPLRSDVSGQVGAAGPAAADGTDGAIGPRANLGDGEESVWVSTDGGTSWQRVDTAAAPWAGNSSASVDLVAFHGPELFVAGTVDGQLAVWSGTPAPGPGVSQTAPSGA